MAYFVGRFGGFSQDDPRFWVFDEAIHFLSDREWWSASLQRKLRWFTIPAGFACDLASIPWWLRVFAPTQIGCGRAGGLHDYLYWTGILPKGCADAIFYEALRAERVGRVRAYAMWLAVYCFGWRAWWRHRRRERSLS